MPGDDDAYPEDEEWSPIQLSLDGFRTLVEATFGIFEPKMAPDGNRIAYQDGGSIYVIDVSTGEASEVAEGRMAAWVDDETLIVAPDQQRTCAER